ncbi:hypothetical protein D3C83_254420 [compost metagenome]
MFGQLAVQVTQNFALVLLQEAVAIIFRVALKIDHLEAVGTDGHVHPALRAFRQHGQASGLQLSAGNVVVA